MNAASRRRLHSLRGGAAAIAVAALLAGCYREKRQFETPPSGQKAMETTRLTALQPGEPEPKSPAKDPYEENAYAVSQGQQLFRQYNCNGCHAQGGGDSGPALMDGKWIYGSEPANVFATIAQGRPNGMPSFGGHVPEDQIWQLVAYVRSMSGLLRSDVAPGRSDSLQASEPEQRREAQPPKPASLPPSSEH
ncbi:MAG: c-type cytochrome [Burkholderiaceae bacterium]